MYRTSCLALVGVCLLALSGCTKLMCKDQIRQNKSLVDTIASMRSTVREREEESRAWKAEADLRNGENLKLQADLQKAIEEKLALDARNDDVRRLLDDAEAAKEGLQRLLDTLGLGPDGTVRIGPGGVYLQLPNQILFDSGKIELKAEARKALDATILVVLRENPAQNIRIDGHTDGVPITASRWEDLHHLSAMRAHAVMKHLASKGISPGRMHIAGMGPNAPLVAPAKPQDDVPENRRVEILLLTESGRSLLGDIMDAFDE